MSFAKNTLTMPPPSVYFPVWDKRCPSAAPFFLIYLFLFSALNTTEAIAVSGRQEVAGNTTGKLKRPN